MKPDRSLDEMYVMSFLKLQLLRQGYEVQAQTGMKDSPYDMYVLQRRNKKGPVPSFAIDLKRFTKGVRKDSVDQRKKQAGFYSNLPLHTVYVKEGGQEIVTDRELADLISSDEGVRVVPY